MRSSENWFFDTHCAVWNRRVILPCWRCGFRIGFLENCELAIFTSIVGDMVLLTFARDFIQFCTCHHLSRFLETRINNKLASNNAWKHSQLSLFRPNYLSSESQNEIDGFGKTNAPFCKLNLWALIRCA